MKMPWFLQNDWVKWVGWIVALDLINTLASNFHWLYNAEIWDLIWSVVWAVDSWLEMTWINSAIASFEQIASGASVLWAVALSNEIMKDFWMVSEWNTWGLKNIARYLVNWAAGIWAFSAWSAAIPYIIWGSITYWAGKHGWKASKETLKWIYSWVLWTAKSFIKSPFDWIKAIKNSYWDWNFKINPQIG